MAKLSGEWENYRMNGKIIGRMAKFSDEQHKLSDEWQTYRMNGKIIG